LQAPDFKIPFDIEVDRRFYDQNVQRAWVNEWLLMLLAKEVLLHSGVLAKKGASLRQWKTLAGTIDRINKLENEIYGEYGSPDNVLVELIRIAHRTFEWQGNGPHASAIIRYHKILNTPEISRAIRIKRLQSVHQRVGTRWIHRVPRLVEPAVDHGPYRAFFSMRIISRSPDFSLLV
jgi:hypothetical protein